MRLRLLAASFFCLVLNAQAGFLDPSLVSGEHTVPSTAAVRTPDAATDRVKALQQQAQASIGPAGPEDFLLLDMDSGEGANLEEDDEDSDDFDGPVSLAEIDPMDGELLRMVGDILRNDPEFTDLPAGLQRLFPIEYLQRPKRDPTSMMDANYVPSHLHSDAFNWPEMFGSSVHLVPSIVYALRSAPPQDMHSCEADVKALNCGSSGSQLFCLGLKRDAVSAKCVAHIEHSVPFACAREIDRHCGRATSYTEIQRCLTDQDEVSPRCTVSLQATADAVQRVVRMPGKYDKSILALGEKRREEARQAALAKKKRAVGEAAPEGKREQRTNSASSGTVQVELTAGGEQRFQKVANTDTQANKPLGDQADKPTAGAAVTGTLTQVAPHVTAEPSGKTGGTSPLMWVLMCSLLVAAVWLVVKHTTDRNKAPKNPYVIRSAWAAYAQLAAAEPTGDAKAMLLEPTS